MLSNNIKRKSWHNYQIVYDGLHWYAWYYVDLNDPVPTELEEIIGNKEA